jgi:hypothetical protein
MLTFLSVYSLGIVFFTFFFGVINGYQKEDFEDIQFLLVIIWPATILIGVFIVFFTIIAEAGLWFGGLVKKFITGLQLKNRGT